MDSGYFKTLRYEKISSRIVSGLEYFFTWHIFEKSKNAGGRPKALSYRNNKNPIFEMLRLKKILILYFIEEKRLNIWKNYVCNAFKKADNLQGTEKLEKPPLLSMDKIQRFSFSQKVIIWTTKWPRILFNEKESNINGSQD